MKKLLFCAAACILMLMCAVSVAASSQSSLELECIDGKAVASGSFVADGGVDDTYRVVIGVYDDDENLVDVEISDKTPISSGINEFSFSADIISNIQHTSAYVWRDSDLMPLCESRSRTFRGISVLAIGNSFTDDAMQWIYQIAKDAGADFVTLGNAFVAGCSLQTHYNNTVSGSGAYTFHQISDNTEGEWYTENSKSIEYCLTKQKWNLITVQQVSGSSGLENTFDPYLENLISWVNDNKTNPHAEIAWHMTWAYQQNSRHSAFSYYNKDQITMYNAIVSASKNRILTDNSIDMIIPSGTAIQNLRTSFIGDTLTRDGYHLSYNLGRYAAGMTWVAQISGISIDSVSYVPDEEDITPQILLAVKEAVNNAVLRPLEVTQSVYTEAEAALLE